MEMGIALPESYYALNIPFVGSKSNECHQRRKNLADSDDVL